MELMIGRCTKNSYVEKKRGVKVGLQLDENGVTLRIHELKNGEKINRK